MALVSVRLVVVKSALSGIDGSIVSVIENDTLALPLPHVVWTPVTVIVCGPWPTPVNVWLVELEQATAVWLSSLQVVLVGAVPESVKLTVTLVVAPGSSTPAVGEVIVTVGAEQLAVLSV